MTFLQISSLTELRNRQPVLGGAPAPQHRPLRERRSRLSPRPRKPGSRRRRNGRGRLEVITGSNLVGAYNAAIAPAQLLQALAGTPPCRLDIKFPVSEKYFPVFLLAIPCSINQRQASESPQNRPANQSDLATSALRRLRKWPYRNSASAKGARTRLYSIGAPKLDRIRPTVVRSEVG